MREMVLPCLWATALAMLLITAVLIVSQSTVLGLDQGLRALIDGPLADDLRCAAMQGDADAIDRILSRRPDLVDSRDGEGWTPLHEAARAGNTGAVRALLRRGACIDARNNAGHTPLHLAARAGEQAAAKVLIAGGADTSARDKAGCTPADVAARYGWLSIGVMIRGYGGGAVSPSMVKHRASRKVKGRRLV